MISKGNRKALVLFVVRVFLVFSMFVIILATGATAQTTTYTYTSTPYFSPPYGIPVFESGNFPVVSPSICPIKLPFTTPQPIPPNSYFAATPMSFSVTDCANTTTNLNAIANFQIFTNAQGQIVQWAIDVLAAVNVPVVVNVNGIDSPDFTAQFLLLEIQSSPGDEVRYTDTLNAGANLAFAGAISGTWMGGTSSCQMPQPSSRFFQGSAQPAIPPNYINAPVTAYAPIPTVPVPQYFGLLPSPNPTPPNVLCPTIKSGCALSVAATMLSTFPNLITPTSLDSEIKAAQGYDDGTSLLCPPNNPTCSSSMLIPYSDRCEMNWFAPQLVAPDAVDWIDGQEASNNQLSDNDASVTINQYLDDHVCGHQDRVVLELSENVDNVPRGHHFVYVTGQNGSDWNVFDPGWQNVTKGTSSTLSGHIAGFTANGSTRTFTVAGVRTYRDITSTGNTGAFAATGNSPIELLVVVTCPPDPQGGSYDIRRL